MKRLQDSLMDGADGASTRLKDEWRLCAPTLATEWSPLQNLCVPALYGAVWMEDLMRGLLEDFLEDTGRVLNGK